MSDPELIPDEEWDNYSLLPNPKWYEKQKEKDDELA